MKTSPALLVVVSACLAGSLLPQDRGRKDRSRQDGAEGSLRWEITPQVEKAARDGLAWLAAHQDPGGFWACDVGYKLNSNYNVTKENASHVGVTSLALIAFLAGGHLPGRGQYGDVLERGLQFVLSCAQDDGYITANGTRMYDHAFATLFLAEVYGMTRREEVKLALQRSVNLIVACQNAEGGWRYKPFARDSDMSITVCQVMALRSSRNIGINVPYSTIDAAVGYVRRSAVEEGSGVRHAYFPRSYVENDEGAFRYQPIPGSRVSFPLTAAGLTTLYGAGVYDDPLIDRALAYMKSTMEGFDRNYRRHYFFYYGHYYAVQAFYMAGGEHWAWYFPRIRDELLKERQGDGSWPNGGEDAGPGPAFATAVATLILEIPCQYLPIFQR